MATWLGNLFEGLKQGYMDAGGATPSNVFSGPTPLEGNAPAGFAGGLGNFAGGIGGMATDLALHTLPDLIKNPSSFFNDRGELSITRVISPEFRREKIKEANDANERQKAALAASAIVQGHTFLQDALGLRTPEGRAAASGVYNDPRFDAAAQAAAAEGAAGQKGALAAGLLPEVAALALPEDALKAGEKQQADRLAREQNVQQAELTRGTQTHQFGLSKQLAGIQHQNRMDEIGYGGDVQAAQKKFQARLDVWKDQKTKKDNPNPYPVIAGLYDEGAFKGNPQLEQVAGYHIANPTDREGASNFLNEYQKSLLATSRGSGSGGRLGSTVVERQGPQQLASLNDALVSGRVPEAMIPEAERIIANNDFIGAREMNKNRLSALAPKVVAPLSAARAWTRTPDFQSLEPSQQQAFTANLEAGNAPYVDNVMKTVTARGLSAGKELMSNPVFSKAAEDVANTGSIIQKLHVANQAATVPGDPTKYDDALFSKDMAMKERTLNWTPEYIISTLPKELQARKQALMTAAGLSYADFAMSRSGKVISDKERQFFKGIWPNGNEPNARMYAEKTAAVEAATEAMRQIAENKMRAAAEMRKSGNPETYIKAIEASADAQYEGVAKELRQRLLGAETNPALQDTNSPITQDEIDAARKAGIDPRVFGIGVQ